MHTNDDYEKIEGARATDSVSKTLTSSPRDTLREAAATARAAGLILQSLSTSNYVQDVLSRSFVNNRRILLGQSDSKNTKCRQRQR